MLEPVGSNENTADPSVRRRYIEEFKQRHKFSAPMHRQPSDKVFAKIFEMYQKRELTCFPPKDVVCVLDQDSSGLQRQVTAQNGVLRISYLVPRRVPKPNRRKRNSRTALTAVARDFSWC